MREWRAKPSHIHGYVEDCVGGRDVRVCDGCGASEEEISVPDYQNPKVPMWRGFNDFLSRHKDCMNPPTPLTRKGEPDKRYKRREK